MVAETIMSTTARFQLSTIRAMKPRMRLHRERIEMTARPTPGIDTTQAPRGVISARSLVDAVMASDDRVERHYLEAKSDLALTTKKDQAKLAKFILGAANRMPDKAAKAFEGYAVMVIGASADRCVGIPPIETLAIERAVLPYIGADGPKWDLLRVPVPNSQNEVLLLVVDPPQSGQGPFICHKEGDGLLDGAVYIRADGETRQAKADELKALIRRGESIAPSVDFEVAIKGDVVRATMDHEVALDDYIAAERQRLISALPAHRRPTHLHPDPADARHRLHRDARRSAHDGEPRCRVWLQPGDTHRGGVSRRDRHVGAVDPRRLAGSGAPPRRPLTGASRDQAYQPRTDVLPRRGTQDPP